MAELLLIILFLILLTGFMVDAHENIYMHVSGPKKNEKLGNVTIFQMCNSPNTVALTYDDGPHPKNTPNLLDILKEENVTATFFIMGSRVENTESHSVMRRMANEGHEIASHTYSHPNVKFISQTMLLDELITTEKFIQATTGTTPKLFRAPYGEITPEAAEIITALGYSIIYWSFDSRDWEAQSADEVESPFEKYSTPMHPYIILFHDIWKRSIDAQRPIIRRLKSLGYRFVTVSECIGLSPKSPNPAPLIQRLLI